MFKVCTWDARHPGERFLNAPSFKKSAFFDLIQQKSPIYKWWDECW
jgi:hypothetical protein